MSYLFPEGAVDEFGVLKVGSNIDVNDGIISVPQNLNITSSVTFDSVHATTDLTLNNKTVVTSIIPKIFGDGLDLTDVVSNRPNASFTLTNTGVTKLVAGDNITLSAETGVITVSATGSGIVKTHGAAANYTATAIDEYIGVTANPTTITLPTGVVGKSYTVKNEGAGGSTTVIGTGGQTLDGAISKSLNNNASITVIFRNAKWNII